MKIHTVLILCLALFGTGCERKSISLSLENPIELTREDAVIVVDVGDLKEREMDFNPRAFVVLDGDAELPSQADDLDGDDEPDQIAFVADFEPGETKQVTLRYEPGVAREKQYTKRTQAVLSHKTGGAFTENVYVGGEFVNAAFLRIPDEHVDHDEFLRFEGPGWESDRVGYRFYLDRRNAIDIFGKKIPDMVLQNVGWDEESDSYHEMADWGMDILQVGESLGIGSVGMWADGKVHRVSEVDSITCEIIADGPVRSQIRTSYYGWKVGNRKYDLTSDLSIAAGSRMTEHRLHISPPPENLCTGLVIHPDCETLRSDPDKEELWHYFALYGPQSLTGDNLGTAIIFHESNLVEMAEDGLSHVILMKPEGGELAYYFLAAWEQEPGGIRNRDQFEAYLDDGVRQLSSPVVVTY